MKQRFVGLLMIGLSELAVCGELTTEDGPGGDDYFLAFVARDGTWSTVSWDEVDEPLGRELAELLGSPLEPGLANRTDFVSRVLWPESLRDEPMFELTARRDSTVSRRWADAVLGTREIVLHLWH